MTKEVIEITLPMSFEERSRLDMVVCAIESDDLDLAIERLKRLSDPRAVEQAATAIGGAAAEAGLVYVMLDMTAKVQDRRLRIGWLIECIDMGVDTTLEGVGLRDLLQEELDDSPDGEFVHAIMMFLDQMGGLNLRETVLEGICDPDLIGMSIVPNLSYA